MSFQASVLASRSGRSSDPTLLIVGGRLEFDVRGECVVCTDVARLGLPHVAGISSHTSSTWYSRLLPAGDGW